MGEFLQVSGEHVAFSNLFNEEHTQELLATLPARISSLEFRNVGVKVMRLVLNALAEVPITAVSVHYDWNTIMTTPQLVCYDKTQWKTLQQLSNWNREWNELFSPCYALAALHLTIRCSWMDDQFVKKLLEGVVRLPNIAAVSADLSSKSQAVEDVLHAVQKAGLFKQFKHSFQLQK